MSYLSYQTETVVENGIEYDVRIYADGSKFWDQNGKLHRDDGPAIEHMNGTKEFYQNGELHRIDGPAVDRVDGTKWFYWNGRRHRIDGPAIEYADGLKWFFYHDVDITDEIEELGYQYAEPEFLSVMIPLIAAGKNR